MMAPYTANVGPASLPPSGLLEISSGGTTITSPWYGTTGRGGPAGHPQRADRRGGRETAAYANAFVNTGKISPILIEAGICWRADATRVTNH